MAQIDREALEALPQQRRARLEEKRKEMETAPEGRREAYGKWFRAQEESIRAIRHTLARTQEAHEGRECG